jgi:hypothetical protein
MNSRFKKNLKSGLLMAVIYGGINLIAYALFPSVYKGHPAWMLLFKAALLIFIIMPIFNYLDKK